MDTFQIAIFASGTGSNAVKIIEHFKEKTEYSFVVLSNKKDAPVLEKTKNLGVESFTFDRKDFYESEKVVDFLKAQKVRFVILAGFLWLVPPNLITAFMGRVINIHPALLPDFGGKGMYGMKVHQAVIDAKEAESGITIHYVNQKYDEGHIIFQDSCEVLPTDTPETLAQKIHTLEHEHFPKVVARLVGELFKIDKLVHDE